MAAERFLITGALGCIGAWVVRNLVHEGVPATIFDLGGSQHRLKLIMSDDEIARVNFITGDVTDLNAIETALANGNITHIIHLAALQVPFCKANPPLGAAVNVVGTVNIFEAAKRYKLSRVVYASSVAVYGAPDEYAEHILQNDAAAHPNNHYGVYKQANEGTARIYWQDDRLSSIGLRPYTIYGPARDQGMTSSPTKAMLAAAAGQPYHITFGGTNGFQYTDDVAKIFIQAARAPFEGAGVFNLGGEIASMQEMVDAIVAAEPTAKITFDSKPLALPEGTDDSALVAAIGKLPNTPLKQGVAATVSHFKSALAQGKITAEVA
jgi:UDP-glucuronate 4-epimerase